MRCVITKIATEPPTLRTTQKEVNTIRQSVRLLIRRTSSLSAGPESQTGVQRAPGRRFRQAAPCLGWSDPAMRRGGGDRLSGRFFGTLALLVTIVTGFTLAVTVTAPDRDAARVTRQAAKLSAMAEARYTHYPDFQSSSQEKLCEVCGRATGESVGSGKDRRWHNQTTYCSNVCEPRAYRAACGPRSRTRLAESTCHGIPPNAATAKCAVPPRLVVVSPRVAAVGQHTAV